MAKIVRISYHAEGGGRGVANAQATVITPSSQETSHPAMALTRQGVGDPLRTKTGWTIVEDQNDKIDFNRGGVTFATIGPGTYATGALLAAAIVAALETADATPAWACTYSTTTKKFTISTGAHNFTLLFSTGANKAESVHICIGFASTDTASALTHTGGSKSYQSRHWIDLDLGEEQIEILSGVNDKLDFDRGGVLVATIEPGIYTYEELEVAVEEALEAADPTPAWSVTYPNIGGGFTVSTAAHNFALLLETGANLATSIWYELGFTTGTDTASDLSHDADLLPPHNEVYSAAIVAGHNVSRDGQLRFDAHREAWDGLDATVDFTDDIEGNGDTRVVFFAEQAYRYIRLVIDDVQNATGYAEVAVFYVGPYVTPSRLQNKGRVRDPEQLSEIVRAIGGANQQIRRPIGDAWSLTWMLFDQDQEDLWDALNEAVRLGGNFFLTFDSTGAPTTTTVYGYFVRGPRFDYGDGEVRTLSLTFAEVLP